MVPPLWVDSDLRGWLRFTRLQSFRAAAARTAHRITTDQKAAISRAVVRAISVKTRKLTRQSDQILVPDDRERGAEREESGNSDLLPGKTLFAIAICTPFPRDFRRRRGTVARASTFYERV